ncbi:MAG TPA: hypothetical protein VJU83_09605 [Burkholderiales bacterium]|nr:hypothetical protein [Burkholderiales bacterium]
MQRSAAADPARPAQVFLHPACNRSMSLWDMVHLGERYGLSVWHRLAKSGRVLLTLEKTHATTER